MYQMARGKLNCWEFKKCGRETGGKNVHEMGVCPAATDKKHCGINQGSCAGRYCWAVAGTFCSGVKEGIFATKLDKCSKCNFFQIVQQQEGKGFVLLNEPAEVKNLLDKQFETEKYRDKLEQLVKERTSQLKSTQIVTIECMAKLAEYRNKETGLHIKRTQLYVKELALYLKGHPRFKNYLDPKTIDMLYISAPLHDIGKVGIPDNILTKQGKLTDLEYEEMKKHTIYGRDTLAESEKQLTCESFLKCAKQMAASHHEKWDGSGYPLGLKGDDIPIPGRLMALADVYDALIFERPYKTKLSHERATQIIKEGRGTHFDPDIVEAFIALESKFKEIAKRQTSDD